MSNSAAKREVLKYKINEYFSKHPNAKSVVIKSEINGIKTAWRVVKEQKSYKITEVNSVKKDFLLERDDRFTSDGTLGTPPGPAKITQTSDMARSKGFGPITDPKERASFIKNFSALYSQLDNQEKSIFAPRLKSLGIDPKELGESKINEVSVKYSNISKAFMDAIGDEAKMAVVRKQAEQAINDPEIKKNPDEWKKLGDIIGMLSVEGDRLANVAGSTRGGTKPGTTGGKPGGFPVTSGKTNKGKVVKEAEETNTDPDQESQPQIAPEEQDKEPKETEEQASITRTLKGQTIQDVNLDLTPEGAELIIQIVGTPTPAKLEWQKSGKIVYTFQGVPYTIRKA